MSRFLPLRRIGRGWALAPAEGMRLRKLVAFPLPSAGGGARPVSPGPGCCGLSKCRSLHSHCSWSQKLRLRPGPRWGRVLASPVTLQVVSAASVYDSWGNSASAVLLSMSAVWFYFGLFIDQDDPAIQQPWRGLSTGRWWFLSYSWSDTW